MVRTAFYHIIVHYYPSSRAQSRLTRIESNCIVRSLTVPSSELRSSRLQGSFVHSVVELRITFFVLEQCIFNSKSPLFCVNGLRVNVLCLDRSSTTLSTARRIQGHDTFEEKMRSLRVLCNRAFGEGSICKSKPERLQPRQAAKKLDSRMSLTLRL